MIRHDPMPERRDLQLITFGMNQLQLPELFVIVQEPDNAGIRLSPPFCRTGCGSVPRSGSLIVSEPGRPSYSMSTRKAIVLEV